MIVVHQRLDSNLYSPGPGCPQKLLLLLRLRRRWRMILGHCSGPQMLGPRRRRRRRQFPRRRRAPGKGNPKAKPRRQLPRQLCKLLLHKRRGSALARVAIVGQSLHGVGKGVASVVVYPLDGHARRKLRVVRVVRRQVRRRLGSELVNLRIRRSRCQPVNHSRRQVSGGGRDARIEAGGESSVASRELLLKRPAIWLTAITAARRWRSQRRRERHKPCISGARGRGRGEARATLIFYWGRIASLDSPWYGTP